MERTRKTFRAPKFHRLFEFIRQGDLANDMANRPVTHGAAHGSDLLVLQIAAAQSLNPDAGR
ncbi:hypothetical protein [Roseovarius sp. 2305UL8-3]|uniref:hypothetical protein n=1 Tax=Roseovarius conchicola TaxID=3121636 RepID=UPI003527D72F